MARRKGDAFAEFVTGVFMLAVLALLVYFTIVISGVDLVLGREYVRVAIAFDGIGGLKDHDNVMYRGTKVGTVDRVSLTSTNLVATVDIDRNVVLRTGYRAYVQSMSLLGGNCLVLEEGVGEKLDLASGVALRGETPTDWMRDVAQIAKNLSDATSGGELRTIVTNLSVVSEKIRLVSERIADGEGTLGRLSADDALYKELEGLLRDARQVLDNYRDTTPITTFTSLATGAL